MKIMLFQGSARSAENCPDEDGKTYMLVNHVVKHFEGDVEFDICDLSVVKDQIIMPCKGCISTSKYHCTWHCSCYGPGSGAEGVPDLLSDKNVYGRLEEADGFVVFAPVNWYSVPTQVKALFDRLVCANMTLTKEFSWSKNIKKDARKSKKLSVMQAYDDELKNHLEGKVAGFYIHGDDGADDYLGKETADNLPPQFTMYPERRTSPADAIHPIVQQCRYSGIHVPEELIVSKVINRGEPYAKANSLAEKNKEFLNSSVDLVEKMVQYIEALREV